MFITTSTSGAWYLSVLGGGLFGDVDVTPQSASIRELGEGKQRKVYPFVDEEFRLVARDSSFLQQRALCFAWST